MTYPTPEYSNFIGKQSKKQSSGRAPQQKFGKLASFQRHELQDLPCPIPCNNRNNRPAPRHPHPPCAQSGLSPNPASGSPGPRSPCDGAARLPRDSGPGRAWTPDRWYSPGFCQTHSGAVPAPGGRVRQFNRLCTGFLSAIREFPRFGRPWIEESPRQLATAFYT